MRKFGRLAETAESTVELACQLLARGRERRAIERRACLGRRRRELAEYLDQRVALLFDLRAMAAVVLCDPAQQVGEGGHAVTRFRWKIRAAEERPLIVR